MPRTAPVFLVGAERSGSTLLRSMLAHHSQIAFGGEFDFLVDAISADGRFMKRANFLKAIELDRSFARHRLTIPLEGNFPAIANNLLDQIEAGTPGAKIVGATLFRDFDRILYLWPEARFIHLVRDGRDVAMSTLPTGLSGNLWHAIQNWVEVEVLWERMSHKLPIERQITVKYEMLARDPEYELRRLTDFLEIAFDPAMLRHNDDGSYSAPPGDSVGRWRNADPGDLGAAEHRAARWLLQNGYFLSGSVRSPSIIRRASLRLQHRMAISKRRRALFGTKMWLKGVLLGRFGSQKAKDALVRRENEILDRRPG